MKYCVQRVIIKINKRVEEYFWEWINVPPDFKEE